MSTIRLACEGSSDDTFGVYGKGVDADYDNCASGKPITFRVRSVATGGESVLVVGQYAPGVCAGWLIGVAPDESEDGEERPIPAWPMHFERSDRPYSPRLVIDVPLGATVEHVPTQRSR